MFPKNPKPNEEFRHVDGRITMVYRHLGGGNWIQVRTEVERTPMQRKWAEVAASAKAGINPRKLTGHDGMGDPSMRPDAEVQDAKNRVFGTRTGQTDMFWHHATMGLIVLPATGDTTHRQVEENPTRYTSDQAVASALKDKQGILAFGRAEDRSEVKWVSVYSRMGSRVPSSVIRGLRKRYPRHSITDGMGNEIMEAVAILPFRSWIEIGI